MAIDIPRRGRPCYVAELDFQTDEELRLRNRFFKVCSTLNYREVMALSRALGINERTIRAWRNKEQIPKWYVVLQVISWAKRNKPMRKVAPWQSSVDMF